MNKKVFTLLPIFSLFSLTGCKPTPSVTYDLIYHFNNGTTPEETYKETYEVNENTVRPAWKPTHSDSGLAFEDWFTDKDSGASFNFGSPLTKTTDIFARWTGDPTSYTLTYHFNNNPAGSEQAYVETYGTSEQTEEPDWVPTYDDHTFKGWYAEQEGDTPFEFGSTLSGNTEIYAHWEPIEEGTCTLTYYFNNEITPEQTYVETYDIGDIPNKPDWVPTYDDHTFKGWYQSTATDAEEFSFNTPLTDDVNAYAHWDTVTPTDPFVEVEESVIKSAAEFALDFDFLENKYVNKGYTKTGGIDPGTGTITAIIEDTATEHPGAYLFSNGESSSHTFANPGWILNSAAVDYVKTSEYNPYIFTYYISYGDDNLPTGFRIIGEAQSEGGDVLFEYNRHCAMTKHILASGNVETFTYSIF